MKKKIIIAAVVTVVIAAGVTTSIFLLKGKKTKPKETVTATYADYILQSAENFEYSTLTGKIFSGGSQNVYINDGDTLGQILVKVGDNVEVGTPLVTLDANRLKLELDSCNLKVQQDDISINNANKLITKYQNAVPIKEEPETPDPGTDEPDEPTDEPEVIDPATILKTIDSFDNAMEGDGSAENPYIFRCTGDCVINAKIFKNIVKKNYNVMLYIYSEDMDDFQYTCSLTPPDAPVKIDKNYSWSVGKIQVLSDGSNIIQLSDELPPVKCEYAVYIDPDILDDDESGDQDLTDDEFFDDELQDIENFDGDSELQDISDGSDPDVTGSVDNRYTKEELADLIAEQQNRLSELQLQKRENQIAAKKAQNKYDAATISSTMKGVVTAINPDASASEPVVTIAAGNGLYVTTVIDEYSYSSTKVGDPMYITTWTEEGEVDKAAKITDISPYPSTSNEYSYSSNPNVSFYPVTSFIEDTEGLKAGDYVTVSIGEKDSSSSYYVEGAYLGKDKKGAFLYVATDDCILHKEYVTTGKNMYGYTEIKDFDIGDYMYIASPYTKNVKEGAKANPDDEY